MFWFGLNIVHAAIVYKLLAVCLQTGHATTSLACPPKSIWILRRFLYPAPKTPSINAVLGSPLGSKPHNLTHDSRPCQSKAVELRAIWSRWKLLLYTQFWMTKWPNVIYRQVKMFPWMGVSKSMGRVTKKGLEPPLILTPRFDGFFATSFATSFTPYALL